MAEEVGGSDRLTARPCFVFAAGEGRRCSGGVAREGLAASLVVEVAVGGEVAPSGSGRTASATVLALGRATAQSRSGGSRGKGQGESSHPGTTSC